MPRLRYGDRAVTFLHRQPNGRHAASGHNLTFPGLPPVELNRFLQLALSDRQYKAVLAFRDWLRQGAT